MVEEIRPLSGGAFHVLSPALIDSLRSSKYTYLTTYGRSGRSGTVRPTGKSTGSWSPSGWAAASERASPVRPACSSRSFPPTDVPSRHPSRAEFACGGCARCDTFSRRLRLCRARGSVQLPVIKITRVGREIASILPAEPEDRCLRKAAELLRPKVHSIELCLIGSVTANGSRTIAASETL